MFSSETIVPMESGVAAVSLTDADLDQVAGGFLPVLAGIVVGAIAGGVAVAVLAAAADGISHHTGHGCLFS